MEGILSPGGPVDSVQLPRMHWAAGGGDCILYATLCYIDIAHPGFTVYQQAFTVMNNQGTLLKNIVFKENHQKLWNLETKLANVMENYRSLPSLSNFSALQTRSLAFSNFLCLDQLTKQHFCHCVTHLDFLTSIRRISSFVPYYVIWCNFDIHLMVALRAPPDSAHPFSLTVYIQNDV